MSKQLDHAFFANGVRHSRVVKLGDVEQAIDFKELSHGELRKLMTAKDDETGLSSDYYLLSAAMVDDDGEPVLTPEQAASLKPRVFKQLLDFALEVNGIGSEQDAGKA